MDVKNLSIGQYLQIGLMLVGISMFGYGFLSNQQIQSAQTQVVVEESGEDSQVTIMVDISGAISKPGVYTFDWGTRVGEAIDKAGGLEDGADTTWVSKELNQAEKLVDGQKIFIPFMQNISVLGAQKSVENVDTSIINLNTATLAELESLTGIGAKRAEEIVSARPLYSWSDVEALSIPEKTVITLKKEAKL